MTDLRRCLSAARDYVTVHDASRLCFAAVSAWCGVDVAEIEARWAGPVDLLADVWKSSLVWAAESDSGSLESDLVALAGTMAESVSTDEGRAVFFSALPRDGDSDLNARRVTFWNAQFDAAEAILTRARQRGEIAGDVNTADAVRMAGTALCFDPLYQDQSLRPDYVGAVIDIFLHGIAAQPSQGIEEGAPPRSGSGWRRSVSHRSEPTTRHPSPTFSRRHAARSARPSSTKRSRNSEIAASSGLLLTRWPGGRECPPSSSNAFSVSAAICWSKLPWTPPAE